MQTEIDQLEVYYVSKRKLEDAQKKDIQIAVTNYLASNINLKFTRKEVLERTARGKLKQFTSLIEKS